MNPHYQRDYTREQIDEILAKIKMCIADGRYTISLNQRRRENTEFIQTYNIRTARQKEILMQIQAEDFCHALQNKKPGYEHEVLYVFVPQVELFRADGHGEMVDIYTKFNLMEQPSGNHTVVISFHKRNKPIEYLFRS